MAKDYKKQLLGLVILTTVLCILTTDLSAKENLRPTQRSGGVMAEFQERIKSEESQGIFYVLDDTSYTSASTFYLSKDNSCVGLNTRFRFHGPSRGGKPVPEPEHSEIVMDISKHYQSRVPGLGQWYLNSTAPAKHGFWVTTLTGRQINRMFGVPLC